MRAGRVTDEALPAKLNRRPSSVAGSEGWPQNSPQASRSITRACSGRSTAWFNWDVIESGDEPMGFDRPRRRRGSQLKPDPLGGMIRTCLAVGAVLPLLLGCISVRVEVPATETQGEALPVTVGVAARSTSAAIVLAQDFQAIGIFESVCIAEPNAGQLDRFELKVVSACPAETGIGSVDIFVVQVDVPTTDPEYCTTHEAQEWGLISFMTLLLLPAHTCDRGFNLKFSEPTTSSTLDFSFDYSSDTWSGPFHLPMLFSKKWHWAAGNLELRARRATLANQLREIFPDLRTLIAN